MLICAMQLAPKPSDHSDRNLLGLATETTAKNARARGRIETSRRAGPQLSLQSSI